MPGFHEADVDVGIAPLIESLWRHGIWTLLSCENGLNEYAWVTFASAEDLIRFLSIVSPAYDEEDDSLYQRVSGEWVGPDLWQYSARITDAALETWEIPGTNFVSERHPNGRPLWTLTATARFPISDLAGVTASVIGALPQAREVTQGVASPATAGPGIPSCST